MSNDDDASLKLVETIYRAALDPKGYDAFMGSWDDWMSERVQALDDLRHDDPTMTAPHVSAHFEIALRLLERLDLEPATPMMKGPQFLVDGKGRIVWKNSEAQRLFGQTKSLNALDTSEDHAQTLQLFLDDMSSQRLVAPVVLQITPNDGGRPLAFRAERMRESRDDPVALIAALTPVWPVAADKLLIKTHGLSASECAICALLIDGLSPADIAERRGTSVATVRTQIKKLLAKTRQGSQVELISYLFSLMRMAESMPSEPTAPPLLDHSVARTHDLYFNGRRMIVEEHGPKSGQPIVFVHGMLDGTGVTKATKQLLERNNLRLICPHRPAFGSSEPQSTPVPDALTQFGQSMRELLTEWDVDNPVVMGHMAGALYAYAIAAAHPVRGIVNISGGVPIVSPRQFDAMTRRQRLVAYTARFAPSVLPFLVNAGIRQIKGGGDDKFLHSLYEHAPVDQSVLEDTDIRNRILHGYHFTVEQGHVAFATDSYHVVRDWTAIVDQTTPIPVHLVHGRHDPVVAIQSVRDFADLHAPRIALTEVEDAGQLVFYQCPEIVFEAAAALFQKG